MGIPGDAPFVQVDGRSGEEGSGGVREGNVTGVGREGGVLSFLQSCWPAMRPPA